MSLQTPKQPMMAQQPMSAKNNGGGGGVGGGGGGGSRPTTPTNTTNRPNSNDGTVRNTRGPGWLTKKPAKPSITPEFWCRPFMPNPPQLSDVANAYFIGYKDSSDWHFKKLLNVIDWFYRNGPGTFSFAAYLFRENKISFRPIQKNQSKTKSLLDEKKQEKQQQQPQQQQQQTAEPFVIVNDYSNFPKLCCKTTGIPGLNSLIQLPKSHYDYVKPIQRNNNGSLLSLNSWIIPTIVPTSVCKSRLLSKLEKTPPKEMIKSLPKSPTGQSHREFERRCKATLDALENIHSKDDDKDDDDDDDDIEDKYEQQYYKQTNDKYGKLRPFCKGKINDDRLWKYIPRYYTDININEPDDDKDDDDDDDDKDNDEKWLKDLTDLVIQSSPNHQYFSQQQQQQQQSPQARPILWIRSPKTNSNLSNNNNNNINNKLNFVQKIFIEPKISRQPSGKMMMRNLDRQTTTETNPNTTTAIIRGTFSRASTLTAMVLSSNNRNNNNNNFSKQNPILIKKQWPMMNNNYRQQQHQQQQQQQQQSNYNEIEDFFRPSSYSPPQSAYKRQQQQRRRRQRRRQNYHKQRNNNYYESNHPFNNFYD
ncbi:hypothetical protein DERP_007191, partial [Dermatophagoides pteronyssinus]